MGISERKEREKLRKRKEMIDAAERVFFSKGVENTTMDDVAEEAEYSKGTLYLYFRNKEELLYAIKIKASVMLKEEFSKVIDLKKNGLENVRNIGRNFIKFSKEHPDYFDLLMHFEAKSADNLNLEDPYIKESIEEHNPMNLFVEIVEKAQQDGTIRDDIPAMIITHNLWAMSMGVLQMLKKQKQILEIHGLSGQEEQMFEGLFSIIRNGINNNSKK